MKGHLETDLERYEHEQATFDDQQFTKNLNAIWRRAKSQHSLSDFDYSMTLFETICGEMDLEFELFEDELIHRLKTKY